MAVEIRLTSNVSGNRKIKRVLWTLALDIKKHHVVILWKDQEIFRGTGKKMVEWVNQQ